MQTRRKLDPKHAQIAARLEAEIWRRGGLVGTHFPFCAMAAEALDPEPHDPLLSMSRSAAHALARDGKRLTTRLISKPAPEHESLVYAWCRRRRLAPNFNYAAADTYLLADEFYSMRAALHKAEFLNIDGGVIEQKEISTNIPDLFEKITEYGAIHTMPVILYVESIEG